jgi:glycerophosphoryl diester phosphodiesterase
MDKLESDFVAAAASGNYNLVEELLPELGHCIPLLDALQDALNSNNSIIVEMLLPVAMEKCEDMRPILISSLVNSALRGNRRITELLLRELNDPDDLREVIWRIASHH